MQTGRPKARRLPAISGLTTRSDITRKGESGCRPGRRSIHPRVLRPRQAPGTASINDTPANETVEAYVRDKAACKALGPPPEFRERAASADPV